MLTAFLETDVKTLISGNAFMLANQQMEYTKEEIFDAGGYVSAKKENVTYTMDGVTIHTATDGFGFEPHPHFTGAIVNATSRKVTDKFYGGFNDFNMTAVAKAAKGERFFVYSIHGDNCYLVNELWLKIPNGKKKVVNASLIDEYTYITLRCNKAGLWSVIRWRESSDPFIPEIDIPHYNDKHEIKIVSRETGEVIECFTYRWVLWEPFIDIFEKYQAQHMKFDVINENGCKSKQLFRTYRQNKNGSWVRKPF